MSLEKAIEQLKELNVKKVFIQFGEGIKLRIQDIAKKIEENNIEPVICAEVCYGSCDIRENEAKLLGCDAILHIGHEKFVDTEFPVVYWEYFIDADPVPILEKEFDKLKPYEKIGLITSIQFVHTVPKVKRFLEKAGKKVFAHKSLQYLGQVLGCKLDAAKAIEPDVDCFLCISAAKFYGWGLTLSTDKPVLCLDLEKKEIYSLEQLKKKTLKIIAWNKAQFKDAKNVGILVSWKKGQYKPIIFDVKKKIEKLGKNVYILAMDEITPEKLEGLKLDFLLNCACPRIGTDDISRYRLPILNLDQVEI